MSTQERHLMVYASPWVLSETAVQTPFGEELKRLSYCPMGGGGVLNTHPAQNIPCLQLTFM